MAHGLSIINQHYTVHIGGAQISFVERFGKLKPYTMKSATIIIGVGKRKCISTITELVTNEKLTIFDSGDMHCFRSGNRQSSFYVDIITGKYKYYDIDSTK